MQGTRLAPLPAAQEQFLTETRPLLPPLPASEAFLLPFRKQEARPILEMHTTNQELNAYVEGQEFPSQSPGKLPFPDASEDNRNKSEGVKACWRQSLTLIF